MSIYRFTPVQDTFIVQQERDEIRAGKDEILELGVSSIENTTSCARILLKFSDEIYNIEGEKYILHLPIASTNFSEGIELTLNISPILEEWEEGSGTSYNIDNVGASWNFRNETDQWKVSGVYRGDLPEINQKIISSDLNINVDITEIIKIDNLKGILIKFLDENQIILNNNWIRIFSSNSNTIYRPYLEIGVKDAVLEGEDNFKNSMKIVCTNLKSKYNICENSRIELDVIDFFPKRVFSTQSIYEFLKYNLPEKSYWGVEDTYTGEKIVDFSEYTQISKTPGKNWFDFNMNFLEPERYYRFIIMICTETGEVNYKPLATFKVER